MRAACAQVWLVLTSVRALRTLGRATAACRGGGEAQEAACGGGKVAIPAILTRLPDPGHAVRLQDCKVSTFGRALHRLDQVQAQRGGQLRDIGGSLLRSQSRAFHLAAWGARSMVKL